MPPKTRTPITVTVCGGGNGAHCCIGYIGAKHPEFVVNVLTTRPEKWSSTRRLKVTTRTSSWAHKGDIVGAINIVSSDPEDVIPSSDVVLVAAPSHVHGTILKRCAAHLKAGALIGTIFAQGGFDWIVKDAIGQVGMDKIQGVFGLQNIPWICKVTKYGEESRILGPKKHLKVVASPVEITDQCANLVESLFDIPCTKLPNFLNVTLTPSNQIIHPARYVAIFHDFKFGETTYSMDELEKRKGLTLYEDFDALSAEYLAHLDNELQTIKIALCLHYPQLDLSEVQPIKERIIKGYGDDIADTSSLLSVMCTNKGYVGCGTPLTKTPDGRYTPNFGCRLYWEDVPYGLCILKGLAEMLGNIPTPTINKMIYWHQEHMGKEFLSQDGTLNPLLLPETGAPVRYGLHTLDEVVKNCIPKNMRRFKPPTVGLPSKM